MLFFSLMILALTATHGGAQPPSSAPPLPNEELFVEQPGLAVSLVPKATTLRGGDDPGFTVRFQNQGQGTLYLVPHVESNLYISTADGQPVPAPRSGIGSRVAITVTRTQLIRLEPGRSWEAPVAAEYHEEDVSRSHMYVLWGMEKGSGTALLLSPGEYIARFAYINAPGYAASYDPFAMPAGVWEGRIETAPVRFTVIAPTRSQIDSDLKRLGQVADPTTQAQLRAHLLPAADVIDEFKSNRDSWRSILLGARARPPAVTRQLLQVIAALPAADRPELLLSVEASRWLADGADCYALSLLANELDTSRGDLFIRFARPWLAPLENARRSVPDCVI